MKKLFTIGLVFMLITNIFSQTPEKISYQAAIRDNNDQLVINQPVGIKISVLQGTLSGTIVYQETYNPDPQTNSYGLVSVEIGTGIPVTGTFSAINWANGPYFLKTETDPTGGTDYTITGTSELLSVPYALYSKTAENTLNGDYNNLINKPSSISNFSMDANAQPITNLANPANAQDAATKGYVDEIRDHLVEVEDYLASAGLIVKDFDGNLYPFVKIGSQIWMAENLKTTKYNDGSPIPLVIADSAWQNNTAGAYCWYNNDEATYKKGYGALYNSYAVSTFKLCPAGWHVPSDDEWSALIDYLGGYIIAGSKLKETGATHWLYPNAATNETGFKALPGGYRLTDGSFMNVFILGEWWSSTDTDDTATQAYRRDMVNYGTDVGGGHNDKKMGMSVRCLKD